MKRIDTPNSIIIWNGTDRGFNDTPGPPPTEFDAAWCNNVQESLTRPLDQQNILLDGANFDQWTDMLQSYAFSGTPTIATGGVLTVESGGQLGLAAGSIFTSAAGVTFSLLGNVTIGTTDANTLTIESTFDRVILAGLGIKGSGLGVGVDLVDGATVPAGKDLGLGANATVTGDATTTVTAGTIDTIGPVGLMKPGLINFYTVSPAPPTAGVLAWDGSALNIGDNILASGRRIAAPDDSFIAGDINTVNPIADTGAQITMTIDVNESIIISLTSEMENSDIVPLMNFRIEIDGVPTGGTATRRGVVSGVFTDCNRTIKYTSGILAFITIKARFGALNGTTTARNILLSVRRGNT